jgi:uncharacterized protein (DUF2249 family)
VDTNARHQLGLILFHKNEILQNVIEDGLSEGTPRRERLAIYKVLNELEEGLTDALKIDSQAAAEALFMELQRQYPGKFPDDQQRTFVKDWRVELANGRIEDQFRSKSSGVPPAANHRSFANS